MTVWFLLTLVNPGVIIKTTREQHKTQLKELVLTFGVVKTRNYLYWLEDDGKETIIQSRKINLKKKEAV